VLWVDYVDYAGKLLSPDGVPWQDAAATLGWFRQAQGLLGSDVLAIPIWRIAERLVTTTPALPERMRAKPRVTHALRVVLSDDGVRATTTGLARALRAVSPRSLLALTVPMPRLAIALAHRAATGAPDAAIGEEDIDTVAPHLADFLRGFGDVGLDVLLMEGSAGDPAARARELEWCAPVLNTARHYGWDIGLSTRSAELESSARGFDFVISRLASSSPDDLEPRRVRMAGLSANAGFSYLAVPHDASPERVLERLGQYRSGAGH